jgi:hypothetical protein
MGYWDMSERWNVGRKARELLSYRELLAAHPPHGLECTLLLSALSMLLCQTNDDLRETAGEPSSSGLQQPLERLRSHLKATPATLSRLPPMERIPDATSLRRWKLREVFEPPTASMVLEALSREERRIGPGQSVPKYQIGTLLYAMRNAVAHGCTYWTYKQEQSGKSAINGAVFVTKIKESPTARECFYVPLEALFWIANWWAIRIEECADAYSVPAKAVDEFALTSAAA